MPTNKKHLVQLGAFIVAGLLLLVLALFLIGKNQHLIGSHYQLRARFDNLAGLREGNNVRYAGIEIGTVESMVIINDTTLEVTLLINKEMKQVIRKNAIASLASDGLMGNKVVNITPQRGAADYALDGDLLASRKTADIDDLLQGLSGISDDVLLLTGDLRTTVARINQGSGLWKLLGDTNMARHLQRTVRNLEQTSVNAQVMTTDIRSMVADIKAGKGNVGMILQDSTMALTMRQTLRNLESVSVNANTLARDLDSMTNAIHKDIRQGSGPVTLLLEDTATAGNISRTLQHIEKGTASFEENMEALKHNWLFRGYFKKQEKAKAKQEQAAGKK